MENKNNKPKHNYDKDEIRKAAEADIKEEIRRTRALENNKTASDAEEDIFLLEEWNGLDYLP